MNVASPPDWIVERMNDGRPFFATRINDGEMIQMFKTQPEGKELGTKANVAWCRHELGDALMRMLEEIAVHYRDNVLIGCSWNTERADDLCKLFESKVDRLHMRDYCWCHEHWPLEGVADGSTVRLLEKLRKDRRVVLVTCKELEDAGVVLGCPVIMAPSADSWLGREEVHRTAEYFAKEGYTFCWCAGAGLKPTAWQLWKEYPQTSHIDLGHLFNGALGLADYSWLQRKDGWYENYMTWFVPYVRRFLP